MNDCSPLTSDIELGESTDILSQIQFTGIANLTTHSRSLNFSPTLSQRGSHGQFDDLSLALSPTESQFVERSQYPNFAPSDNDIIPSHHFVPNQQPEPVNVNIHTHNSNLPTQASNQNNMSHFPHDKLRSGPSSLTVQQMANEGSGYQVSKLPQAPFRKKFTPNVQGQQLKKDIDKMFGFHVSKKRFFTIYEDISATTGMLPIKIDRSRYRCFNKLYADIYPYREILLANITQEHIAMVRESKNKARVANLRKKNGFNH
ncbi:hypothetical protein M9Y10_011200 [Tritrichomonas musculus]|uniref:Uncharacterized protein n=1 Tax=Tritrichomonas musculus TaxID=1915356 RepID=A0ABR2IJW8_9EUKA